MLWANYRYGELLTGGQKALVGIALLIARLIDAPIDPFVGWWSDRTQTRLGRRRPFVAFGAVPLVVFFGLLWMPPAPPNSVTNIVWLLGTATAFFVVFSLVVNPYLAMLPEIARAPDDRVALSALVAAFGLAAQLAATVGASILAGTMHDFGVAVACTSAVALMTLVFPLLLRESDVGSVPPAELRLGEALLRTLNNRPFRIFLVSKCLYWVAAHSVLAVVPFLVRGVLGFTEESAVHTQTGLLLGCAAAPSFLWFATLKRLARRFSKRRLCLMGLGTLSALSLGLCLVGVIPFEPLITARLLMIPASFTVAVLFSVPNAIIAEIVDLDQRVTGMRREAMFFGAQGLFVKAAWGTSSALVMAAQGALHSDPAMAVRAALVVVAVLGALALVVFRRFPEDAELREMARSAQAGA